MLVICGGMARAGSTVQYQIVCEIIESLALGMTIGWINVPTKELLDSLENVAVRKDKFLVIKSHNCSPQVKYLVETGRAKVVYVYRDLRDVAVSLLKKFANSTQDAISQTNHQLRNYYNWMDIDGIIISRYENMINDLYSEVLKVANYLELSINNSLAKRISSKLELNQQKQRIKEFNYDRYGIKSPGGDMYDPVSQLHKNHIYSGKWGQWKKDLSIEQIESIENLAFSWFVDRGYPLSTFKKDETKTAIEHFKQGRIFKQNGQLAEAENSYRQAIMSSPHSYLYHYNLGEILFNSGNINFAINACRHAIHLNPQSALSHQSLGIALSQAGNINHAIDHYRQAVKIKSNTPRFEKSLGLALIKRNKLNKIQYTSQKGQDKWVIEDIFKGKEKGFFVDIAATDGVKFSNTYILEKYYEWTGICIEPNPDFYASLIKNRSCLCVNDCIDSQEKVVEFRFDNGELGGIISDDTDNCIKYRSEQIKRARQDNKTALLKTKTLETVLDENNAPKIIDYLSLDVEGSETRILFNFPFEKYIFLVITIKRPTPKLNQILFENNYVFVQNSKLMPYDSFYIHKSIPNFDSIKKEPFSQVPPKDW